MINRCSHLVRGTVAVKPTRWRESFKHEHDKHRGRINEVFFWFNGPFDISFSMCIYLYTDCVLFSRIWVFARQRLRQSSSFWFIQTAAMLAGCATLTVALAFDNTKYSRGWWKFCRKLKNRTISHVGRMMPLDEKSEDHLSSLGVILSATWTFAQAFPAIYPIVVKIFNSGPKWWTTAIPRATLKISVINRKTAYSFISPHHHLSLRPFHYLVLSLGSQDIVRSQKQNCYWKGLAVWTRLAETTMVSSASYRVKRLFHSKSFYAINWASQPLAGS